MDNPHLGNPDFITYNRSIGTYYIPPPNEWFATLLVGYKPNGDRLFTAVIAVPEGVQPNRFHRFMQKLCFGVQWEHKPAHQEPEP